MVVPTAIAVVGGWFLELGAWEELWGEAVVEGDAMVVGRDDLEIDEFDEVELRILTVGFFKNYL